MNNRLLFNLNIVLLIIPSIFTCFFPGKIVIVSSICMYFILIILTYKIISNKSKEINNNWIIKVYLFFNVIIFIRGLIDIHTTQDYITFFNKIIFITILYPLYLKIVKQNNIIHIFRSVLYIGIPLAFTTYFLKPTDGFMSFQHKIS